MEGYFRGSYLRGRTFRAANSCFLQTGSISHKELSSNPYE
jgi:hypothetical protein